MKKTLFLLSIFSFVMIACGDGSDPSSAIVNNDEETEAADDTETEAALETSNTAVILNPAVIQNYELLNAQNVLDIMTEANQVVLDSARLSSISVNAAALGIRFTNSRE